MVYIEIDVNYYWLNFYGEPVIKKYGLERLKEGAEKVFALNNGMLCINEKERERISR